MVTHIAVDGVGEVDHGGTARHRHDAALGCEHIDRVGEQVHFDMVPKLRRITCFVLDIKQRLQPFVA